MRRQLGVRWRARPLVDRLSDGRGSGCVWPPACRSPERSPARRATATPRTADGHDRTAPGSGEFPTRPAHRPRAPVAPCTRHAPSRSGPWRRPLPVPSRWRSHRSRTSPTDSSRRTGQAAGGWAPRSARRDDHLSSDRSAPRYADPPAPHRSRPSRRTTPRPALTAGPRPRWRPTRAAGRSRRRRGCPVRRSDPRCTRRVTSTCRALMQTLRPPVVSIQTGFTLLSTRHGGISHRPARPKFQAKVSAGTDGTTVASSKWSIPATRHAASTAADSSVQRAPPASVRSRLPARSLRPSPDGFQQATTQARWYSPALGAVLAGQTDLAFREVPRTVLSRDNFRRLYMRAVTKTTTTSGAIGPTDARVLGMLTNQPGQTAKALGERAAATGRPLRLATIGGRPSPA